MRVFARERDGPQMTTWGSLLPVLMLVVMEGGLIHASAALPTPSTISTSINEIESFVKKLEYEGEILKTFLLASLRRNRTLFSFTTSVFFLHMVLAYLRTNSLCYIIVLCNSAALNGVEGDDGTVVVNLNLLPDDIISDGVLEGVEEEFDTVGRCCVCVYV